MTDLQLLMWFFTLIMLIGFIIAKRNLEGENGFTSSRYEGLIIIFIGLVSSVVVGVKSSASGLESFKSLYM